MKSSFVKVAIAALLGLAAWGESARALPETVHRPAAQRQIAQASGQVSGALTAESEFIERDGTYFEMHRFEGEAGEIVAIDLTSQDFDTYLILLDPNEQLIAQDDDGSGRTDSRLVVELPQSGTYTIVANSHQPAAFGRYTVRWEASDRAAIAFQEPFLRGKQLFERGIPESNREADVQFEAALAIAQAASAGFDIGRASVFLGLIDARASRTEAALAHYDTALDGFLASGDRAWEALTFSNTGGALYAVSRYREAAGYYERALAIQQEIGDRGGEAVTLGGLGVVYGSLGNLTESLRYYERALALLEEVDDPLGEAVTLSNIGLAYDGLGDRLRALEYYERALEIARALGHHGGVATTLNNMGRVYDSLGSYDESLSRYDRALSLYREIGDRSGVGTTLGNIGAVYDNLGDRAQALDYYERALTIHRETGERSGEAITLNNIGLLLQAQGDYDTALSYYLQVLPILQSVGSRAFEATTLNNIAGVYDGLGNYGETLNYLDRSLALYREVGDRAGEAATLNNIGGTYGKLGYTDEALTYLNRALPMMREVGDRANEAAVLHLIGQVRRTRGELPAALEAVEATIAIVEQLRSEIGSADLRTSYFATVQEYYRLQIDILMQLHGQNPGEGYDVRAFNVSERTRARTLIELLAEANLDISENIDPALRDRERDLRQQLQTLDAQRVDRLQATADRDEIAAIVDEFDRQTTAVLRELDALASQLRQTDPAYAALQYPEPLELAQVRDRVLDADTTLVQYALGDERSYVWVVTRDGFESFTLAGRDEIETAAREFYASVDRAGNPIATARKATALSELILAPIAHKLTTERLLIVPDGQLHQIPFSALATPNTDGYQPLLVEHEIVSAPSSTVIATNRETMGDRAPAPRRLAVLADPVFTASDPRVTGQPAAAPSENRDIERALRDFDLNAIARLPHTKIEAEQLLALAGGGKTAAFDFSADRDWVTNNAASSYQYVHFATHGFANSENPELSGLVLSLLDENGNSQNGFLRLADIFNLNMPAEMVVLSACQTGLGENVGGEGVVGLTRGLMYAGAERTVLSLWNVSDEKTAELMVAFYANIWEGGMTPVAALRQAQLAMWEAGNHPYYWAAFGVQGEWRD